MHVGLVSRSIPPSLRSLLCTYVRTSWCSLRLHFPLQAVTRKVRILDVNYNASNNELVRTQTLVKNAIVQVDATPFKLWYQKHYNVELGAKNQPDVAPKPEDVQVRIAIYRG